MTAQHHETQHAQMAMTLMQRHALLPTPENYAVWFTYAAAANAELMQDIDKIVNSGIIFSQDTCAYLYNKYFAASRSQKAVDDAAGGAQRVLVEVLKIINEFSGETQSYNKDVDQVIGHISEELGDGSVKDIVRELIEATSKLKKSGDKINEKLEASKQEINSLKKNLQQVTIESQRDFLTGVFNRKTFERFVDEQMLLAREQNSDLCLLMIDIDHFKQFNDKFGHLLGDEVLKIVARTLMDVLKGRDVVARFGGEEFIVILPETPVPGALKVAEMIRATIASKELKRKDTGETYGTINVSIGVSRYRGESDSLPTLIKRADDGLYQAKRNGRNQVVCEPL